MPGELNSVATEFLTALDALDADRMKQMLTEDVQSVDEISRRWLRGRGDVDNCLRELITAVSDVATQLRDAEERVREDTGVLTCWIDQDYTMHGTPQHISAPTTMILRRDGGAWKLALFHSIPSSRARVAIPVSPEGGMARPKVSGRVSTGFELGTSDGAPTALANLVHR